MNSIISPVADEFLFLELKLRDRLAAPAIIPARRARFRTSRTCYAKEVANVNEFPVLKDKKKTVPKQNRPFMNQKVPNIHIQKFRQTRIHLDVLDMCS